MQKNELATSQRGEEINLRNGIDNLSDEPMEGWIRGNANLLGLLPSRIERNHWDKIK